MVNTKQLVHYVDDVLPKTPHDEEPNPTVMTQYFFWANLSCHLLIPCSLYLHLIAPVFTDQQNFDFEIQAILQRDYKDPVPFYSPCSHICLTPFGRQVFT